MAFLANALAGTVVLGAALSFRLPPGAAPHL
jgi:hypothetical protein